MKGWKERKEEKEGRKKVSKDVVGKKREKEVKGNEEEEKRKEGINAKK